MTPLRKGSTEIASGRLSPILFEDVIQPVEYDLVLKARVIHSAVGVAALLRGDDVLRLGTGQLVVKLLTVNSQLSLALATNIEIRTGNLVLQSPQVVVGHEVSGIKVCAARAMLMNIAVVSELRAPLSVHFG